MASQKWSKPYKKNDNQYVIHHTPQLMQNGKFAAKLLIAHHIGSEVIEASIGIKDNLEFETEQAAAEHGLKAGME